MSADPNPPKSTPLSGQIGSGGKSSKDVVKTCAGVFSIPLAFVTAIAKLHGTDFELKAKNGTFEVPSKAQVLVETSVEDYQFVSLKGVRSFTGHPGKTCLVGAFQDMKRREESILESQPGYRNCGRLEKFFSRLFCRNSNHIHRQTQNIRLCISTKVLRDNNKLRLNTTWGKKRGKTVSRFIVVADTRIEPPPHQC